MIISIHAGHGGLDRGTSAGGIDEADYNLAFSASLSAMVHKLFCPRAKPVLVRDSDERVPLTKAAEFAAAHKASLAFAVHVNSYTSPSAHGLRAFADAQFRSLAQCSDTIFRCYPKELTRRGTKHAMTLNDAKVSKNEWMRRPYNVIEPYTRRGIPCLLLELFFASNPRDYDFAHQDWIRQQMLMAICQGIAVHAQDITPETLYAPSTLQ